MTETTKAAPEDRLVHVAKLWRQKDAQYIHVKNDFGSDTASRREQAQRDEYAARNNLRKAIDEVKS